MTRTRAETAFGMALSRARPNVPVPDKHLKRLAREVLGPRGAMDEAASIERLGERLAGMNISGRDRREIIGACAQAIALDAAAPRERPARIDKVERSRLDRILAGIPTPMRF